VDLSTGTGALKVTPAHDPNDFDIGQRHNLPSVKVIADDGTMTDAAGRFEGMDRFACRKAVVAELKAEGLLEWSRSSPAQCGPLLPLQDRGRAQPVTPVVRQGQTAGRKGHRSRGDGKTRIIPESWTKTYYDWMYNIATGASRARSGGATRFRPGPVRAAAS
jgi:valyl-tRNA synthetase